MIPSESPGLTIKFREKVVLLEEEALVQAIVFEAVEQVEVEHTISVLGTKKALTKGEGFVA